MKNIVISILLIVGLAGCATSASTVAAVNAGLAKAQTDAQMAINLYGIAKGIAQVAAVANPALAPSVTVATGVGDKLIASVQIALNAATVDATAVEALVAQIKDQANAITLANANVIKVVPAAS